MLKEFCKKALLPGPLLGRDVFMIGRGTVVVLPQSLVCFNVLPGPLSGRCFPDRKRNSGNTSMVIEPAEVWFRCTWHKASRPKACQALLIYVPVNTKEH